MGFSGGRVTLSTGVAWAPRKGPGAKRVVFVEILPRMPNIGRYIVTPRYGMLAVASGLAERSGYEVVHLFEPYAGRFTPEDVASLDPFCVMTNGLTTTAPDNEEFFRRFREVTGGSVPVVAGGEHATMYPEDARSYADYLLTFEGDESVFPFLSALSEDDPLSRDSLFSQVPGLHYRDACGRWRVNPAGPRVRDLDYRYDLSIAPGAEKAGLRLRATSVPIQTSRGCKHACSFCSWISLFGKPGYRVRPPEDVLYDVVHAMEYVGTKDFIVCDNLFAGDRAHASELMGRLARAFEGKPVRPSLTVCMRADQFVEGSPGALSEREIALLVRGGVSVVSFGLESVEEQSLFQMRKGAGTDKYLEAAKTLRRHGVSFLGTFVAGFDGDTPESIERIAEFAERMGLFTVQIYGRSVTPETTDMVLFWHRILPGRLNRYANGHSVWFLPSLMLPSRLQEEVFRVMLKFHAGHRSRLPAHRVFSGIWDRLQNHQRALRRIESEVLLPAGVYRSAGREFRLEEDRLRALCEDGGSYDWYRGACARIFREEEAAAPFGSPAVRAGAPQVFVGTGPVA